jgi:hypothetical protein
MKKLFVILMSVVALTAFVSCNDKPVPADKLPAKAKTFLNTYFPSIEVISVIKEKDGDYDVYLADDSEVEFKSNGDWKKVDCEGRAVPVGYFPTSILTYVTTNYPADYIEDISYENNRYEVGLGYLDIDLLFDNNGDFIGQDN